MFIYFLAFSVFTINMLVSLARGVMWESNDDLILAALNSLALILLATGI